jgi:hypothetical protein
MRSEIEALSKRSDSSFDWGGKQGWRGSGSELAEIEAGRQLELRRQEMHDKNFQFELETLPQ